VEDPYNRNLESVPAKNEKIFYLVSSYPPTFTRIVPLGHPPALHTRRLPLLLPRIATSTDSDSPTMVGRRLRLSLLASRP
jgi:hypothetical protein